MNENEIRICEDILEQRIPTNWRETMKVLEKAAKLNEPASAGAAKRYMDFCLKLVDLLPV